MAIQRSARCVLPLHGAFHGAEFGWLMESQARKDRMVNCPIGVTELGSSTLPSPYLGELGET